MYFNTTSSNTGRYSGACIIIEREIKKNLLYLACRHHILEIILAAVFKESMGGISSGSDVAIFKRFKEAWSSLDHLRYHTAEARFGQYQ